jgi:hypothetical protein
MAGNFGASSVFPVALSKASCDKWSGAGIEGLAGSGVPSFVPVSGAILETKRSTERRKRENDRNLELSLTLTRLRYGGDCGGGKGDNLNFPSPPLGVGVDH